MKNKLNLYEAKTPLPAGHRDPFDRIIMATAQAHNMTILTKNHTTPTTPKTKGVWA